MKPRVFVAMPFGKRTITLTDATGGNATVEVDFNAIYTDLLAPAIEAAGAEPFRADQEVSAGNIRTDMFFELVTADFVLADVSIENPNVYYELGIRHMVTRRGTVMVNGGWSKTDPFDIRTERYFTYDGSLFNGAAKGTAKAKRAANRAAAANKLGQILRQTFSRPDVEDSPVYALLKGLKEPDWSRLDNVRAKYFCGVLESWSDRMEVARQSGHPGDILTLADEAPTTYHHRTLRLVAANSLLAMRRYERAKALLEELKRTSGSDPIKTDPPYALALGRLGNSPGAEAVMARLVAQHQGDPEAQGVLGRVHKDYWRATWRAGSTLDARRRLAFDNGVRAVDAVRCYARALESHPGEYYTGVNVIGLVAVMNFIAGQMGEAEPHFDLGEWSDQAALALLVEKTAHGRLAAARRAWGMGGYSDELIWAEATLGELALLRGHTDQAILHYRDALSHGRCTAFQAESMVDQLRLYEALGYHEQTVATIIDIASTAHPTAIAAVLSPWTKVVVFHGHMIDDPGRAVPRFPPASEPAVRTQIEAQLNAWGVGSGDLALCGGARGGDILFAEACRARGATVRLMLPLAVEAFIARSVDLVGAEWVRRFHQLATECEVAVQTDRLGDCPPWHNQWERNIRWLNQTASAESEPGHLFALFVWDRLSGDGPGGTAAAYEASDCLGATRAIIRP